MYLRIVDAKIMGYEWDDCGGFLWTSMAMGHIYYRDNNGIMMAL
jgi:hypothetical protein